MNSVLGHDSALLGNTAPGSICDNEIDFGIKHAPDAGSVT